MNLRPVTGEDLPILVKLETMCYTSPWSTEVFRSYFSFPGAFGVVADDGGAILGYALAWSAGHTVELGNLAVVPEARQQGIGRALLRAILLGVEARGGREVFLEVRASNEAAIALYRSEAFVPLGKRRGYYRIPREDALIFCRILDRDD